jgi:hypothetical protein
VELPEPPALGDLPRQGVLPPARTDDEHIHRSESNRAAGRSRSRGVSDLCGEV